MNLMVLSYHSTVSEAFEPVLVVVLCCIVFVYLILTGESNGCTCTIVLLGHDICCLKPSLL